MEGSPERRNLVITSLGFILYHLADGKFANNQLSLQAINLEFGNTQVLKIFSWVMLGWFALRYYQTTENDHQEFTKNINQLNQEKFLIKFVAQKTNLPYDNDSGFYNPSIINRYGVYFVGYETIKSVKRNDLGIIIARNSSGGDEIPVSKAQGRYFRARMALYASIKKPGFTGYYVPYILLIAAVLISAFYYVFPNVPISPCSL